MKVENQLTRLLASDSFRGSRRRISRLADLSQLRQDLPALAPEAIGLCPQSDDQDPGRAAKINRAE